MPDEVVPTLGSAEIPGMPVVLAPPPGAPAPKGTPMADAQPAGTLVVAPVAPLSGPIPANVNAVVVKAKNWWESSEIVTSLIVILGAGVDSVVNAVIPMLSAGPVDWPTVKAALLRSFLTGVFAAFIAYRRKTTNSAVR